MIGTKNNRIQYFLVQVKSSSKSTLLKSQNRKGRETERKNETSETKNWGHQRNQKENNIKNQQEGVLSALKDNKSEDFSAMLDGEIRALENRQREIDEERKRLINNKMGIVLFPSPLFSIKTV